MKTDMMDQFRAGRFAQIANLADRVEQLEAARERGELRKLADGRYLVLRSDTGMGRWDAGEILSRNGMPEHGLDISQDGVTPAFYSSGNPPWWGLGTHITEGLHSAKAACMAAGQDWRILKRRARYLIEDTDPAGDLLDAPTPGNPLQTGEEDMWITVRSDTGRALGQVGKIWTSIHNVDAFSFMEEFGQPFETIGSFRGGKRVFATMALPEDMTVDAEGINEQIKMYVAAVNHHDGNSGLNLSVTPYRWECRNTERLAIANAVTTWTIRHTKNYQEKLDQAKKSLRLVHRYAEGWKKEENALARRPISDAEIASVISDLNRVIWKEGEEDSMYKQRNSEARVLDIMNRWEVERERCGRTAYGFERALTGHLDHGADRRPRGVSRDLSPLALLGLAVMEDIDGTRKATAHRRMMELVKK